MAVRVEEVEEEAVEEEAVEESERLRMRTKSCFVERKRINKSNE